MTKENILVLASVEYDGENCGRNCAYLDADFRHARCELFREKLGEDKGGVVRCNACKNVVWMNNRMKKGLTK